MTDTAIDGTVVGWDGSIEAQAALLWAVRRARTAGGVVHVLRVMGPFPFIESEARWADDATERMTASLDDEVERLGREWPDVTITSELVAGDPTEIFLSRTGPATAVVLGTQHRSAPHFRFAWTFGGRLAAQARGPVVIVPVDATPKGHGIVVGVDGSDESASAVRFAAAEARVLGTSLDIVHAWLAPVLSPLPGLDIGHAPWLAEAHEHVASEAVALAHEISPGLRTVSHVDADTASHALLERASHAAMVVVGARGRTPLASILLGSVSTTLLENMPCPVVLLGPATVTSTTPSKGALSWA